MLRRCPLLRDSSVQFRIVGARCDRRRRLDALRYTRKSFLVQNRALLV